MCICWDAKALTMNISMTQLQDDLAQQRSPLSTEQAKDIDFHSERSIACFPQKMGIGDPLWLEAIKYHHFRDPGKLGEKSIGRQIGTSDPARRHLWRAHCPARGAHTDVGHLGHAGLLLRRNQIRR